MGVNLAVVYVISSLLFISIVYILYLHKQIRKTIVHPADMTENSSARVAPSPSPSPALLKHDIEIGRVTDDEEQEDEAGGREVVGILVGNPERNDASRNTNFISANDLDTNIHAVSEPTSPGENKGNFTNKKEPVQGQNIDEIRVPSSCSPNLEANMTDNNIVKQEVAVINIDVNEQNQSRILVDSMMGKYARSDMQRKASFYRREDKAKHILAERLKTKNNEAYNDDDDSESANNYPMPNLEANIQAVAESEPLPEPKSPSKKKRKSTIKKKASQNPNLDPNLRMERT